MKKMKACSSFSKAASIVALVLAVTLPAALALAVYGAIAADDLVTARDREAFALLSQMFSEPVELSADRWSGDQHGHWKDETRLLERIEDELFSRGMHVASVDYVATVYHSIIKPWTNRDRNVARLTLDDGSPIVVYENPDGTMEVVAE